MQEGGDTARLGEAEPVPVSAETKQTGEMPDRWSWVEPSVWTPRMLSSRTGSERRQMVQPDR